MSINLHLQNLSRMAANLDIRRFFINWDIPEGGVQIVGGPDGDAFIRFNNENDLLKAMALSGTPLLGQPVTLRIISKIEMEQLIHKRKSELHVAGPDAANYHPMAAHSTGMSSDSTYPNPYTQMDQVSDAAYQKRAYIDSEEDEDHHEGGYDGDWKRRKPSVGNSGIAAGGRYGRTNAGMVGGTNYGGYYQGQQQDFSKQRVGNTGRYGQDDRYGNRDSHGGPGYVMLNNLGRSIAYKDLREFFRKYDLAIEKGGIILKLDSTLSSKIAYIKFTTNQDAIRANDLHNVTLQGRPVDIKRVHPNEFEDAKSFSGDRDQMRSNEAQRESYSRDDRTDTLPGYIKIYNLAGSVRYKELREFFRGQDMIISQGGIILRSDQNQDSSTAYVKFCNYQDALKVDSLRYGRIQGQSVEMEMISAYQFEEQKIAEAESQEHSRSTNFERFEMENRGRNDDHQDGSRYRDQSNQPGYIKINNVVASIRYNELREFFRAYDMVIAKGGIILKNYNSDFSTAYIQFVNRQDALRADSTKYGRLQGNNIEMELISANTFENQKAGKGDRYDQPRYDRYDQSSGRSDRNDQGSGSKSGYIQIRNMDRSVRYKELRTFFRLHNMVIAKGGIILPNETSRDLSVVYVKFINQLDATRAESLNTRSLPGNNVHIQRISESKFENQESWQTLQGESKQGTGRGPEEPRQPKKDDMDDNYSPPGYIMLRNISGAVRYKELRAFFRDHDITIAKGGIILKPNESRELCTVYMKFNSLQDALRADSLDYRQLCGEGFNVEMEMISPTIFDYQDAENADPSSKSKWGKADKSDQDKMQPRSFSDLSSAIAPGDKFECFIHLDQLPGDATACEIWGWFDGPHGFSKGVKMVRRVKEGQAMFAYVAFDNAQHRNAAKMENEPCKAWSAKGTYRHLAQFGPQYEVLEATETGQDKLMDEDARTELRQKFYFDPLTNAAEVPSEPVIFTHMVERSEAEEEDSKFLCFLFIRDLPKNASAGSVWGQYGGSVGGSKGAALVRRVDGPAIFAYVAFADAAHRSTSQTDGTRRFSAMNMYMHIAQFGPHCEIEESIGTGGNQILPKEDREFLRKNFFFEKVQVLQSIFSHMVARAEAEAPGVGSLYFLRLSAIPHDATACGMRKWLGGINKTSKGAIVVRKIEPLTAMFAYVAFENKKDRKAALDECEDGLHISVRHICQHLAKFDSEYEILESTDSGKDRVISNEKRESLCKKVLTLMDDEEDVPAKTAKRHAHEQSDNDGDEKKRKVVDTASSDTEEMKLEEENVMPKRKPARKARKRQKKSTAGKGKASTNKLGKTEDESNTYVDSKDVTEEDEIKLEESEDEDTVNEDDEVEEKEVIVTRSTRVMRRSSRRTFCEKQDTESEDEEDEITIKEEEEEVGADD